MLADRPPRSHVEALRACGLYPQGLRQGAHLKAMQALQVLGYVEERRNRGGRDLRWFLTPAGKELLEVLGTGEPRD